MADTTWATLKGLIRPTFTEPRPTLRRVLDLNIPLNIVLQAVLAMFLIEVVLFQVDLLIGGRALPEPFSMISSPLPYLIYVAVNFIVLLIAFNILGKFSKAPGSFIHTVTALAWMSFVLLCLRVFLTLIGLILPGIMTVLLIPVFIFQIYLTVTFAQEVHKMPDAIVTGFALFAILFGMVLATSFLAVLLGFAPAGAP